MIIFSSMLAKYTNSVAKQLTLGQHPADTRAAPKWLVNITGLPTSSQDDRRDLSLGQQIATCREMNLNLSQWELEPSQGAPDKPPTKHTVS